MRAGLQSRVLVDMKVGNSFWMRMPAEQMTMPASDSAELAINIKEPEEQQRPSGDPRKPGADPIVQRDSEPGDEQAQECGNEDVTRTGQRRDTDRLVPVPALRPRRDHEREPMRGNGRVKKSDTESRESDCGKNRFVHEAQNPIIIRTILHPYINSSTGQSTVSMRMSLARVQ